VSELEARVAELERMVGKLAMENEILKKVQHEHAVHHRG
jgi:hypothetical protein